MNQEPPSAPSIERRLFFPPRRVAAALLLSALPLASFAGAFDATDAARARVGDLTLSIRHPTRTLYRESTRLSIDIESARPCARAIVQGLASYLAHFEETRIVPTPASAHRLYDGPLAPHHRLVFDIQTRPAEMGIADAVVALDCDGQRGPRLAISTLVFP